MKVFDSTGMETVPRQNHTSKGDQPKWFIGHEWYKADYMGYESLAEVVVSEILGHSDIGSFVKYEPAEIRLEDRETNGCISPNFKKNNESLITLEKLHRSFFGIGLADRLSPIAGVGDKIKYTVDFVTEITGLKDFGKYLTAMLTVDALFLNEDRHTNNIAVIRNETTGEYRLCPCFDNGLSLLSDLNDYPLETDVYDLIAGVKAKPFDRSFDRQLDAAEALYGSNLKIDYSVSDIERLFESLAGWYEKDILQRVEKILKEQKRKYAPRFVR